MPADSLYTLRCAGGQNTVFTASSISSQSIVSPSQDCPRILAQWAPRRLLGHFSLKASSDNGLWPVANMSARPVSVQVCAVMDPVSDLQCHGSNRQGRVMQPTSRTGSKPGPAQPRHGMRLRSHGDAAPPPPQHDPETDSVKSSDSESSLTTSDSRLSRYTAQTWSAADIRIVTVNCGRAGWQGKGQLCLQYAATVNANVLVVSEAHNQPGQALPLYDDWAVLAQPRSHRHLQNGGVIIVIAKSLIALCDAPPAVTASSLLADVLWVRLAPRAFSRPVALCAVYLPPCGSSPYNCPARDHCPGLGTTCPRSHATAALREIGLELESIAEQCEVVITGDFNARLGTSWPRARAITDILLSGEVPLTVCNPKHQDGRFIATHHMEGQVGTHPNVLDLVLAPLGNTVRVECCIDQQGLISDHLPMLSALKGNRPLLAHPANNVLGAARALKQKSDVPLWALTNVPQPSITITADFQSRMASKVSAALNTLGPAPTSTADLVGVFHQLGALVIDAFVQCGHEISAAIPSQAVARVQRAFQLGPLELHAARSAHTEIERLLQRIRRLRRMNAPVPYDVDAKLASLVLERKRQRLAASALSKKSERLVQQSVFQETFRGIFRFDSAMQISQRKGRLARRRNAHSYRNANAIAERLSEIARQCQSRYGEPVYSTETERATARQYHSHRLHQRAVHMAQFLALQQSHRAPPVSAEEVVSAVNGLKSVSSAIGCPVACVKALSNVSGFITYLQNTLTLMFQLAELPAGIGLRKGVPLAKQGAVLDRGNTKLRIISVGSVFARLYESVFTARVTAFLTAKGLVSDEQYGFVAGRSTEQAILTSRMGVHQLLSAKQPVYQVFVDIETAYPHTHPDALMCTQTENGLPAYLWLLLDKWLGVQQLFVQIGRQNSPLIDVVMGLGEGTVKSPVLFNSNNESTIDGIKAVCNSPELESEGRRKPGLWVNGVLAVSSIWFADDGTMFGPTQTSAQAVLSGAVAALKAKLYSVGVAPTKTAICLHLPYDKTARARVRRYHGAIPESQRDQADPHAPLYTKHFVRVDNRDVPFVKSYKYLGVSVHHHGATAALALAQNRLKQLAIGVYAAVASSGVRKQPLWQGVNVYKLYYFPKVTYAWASVYTQVPAALHTLESRVLKAITGLSHHPDVVMRSVLGLPSLETRLSLRCCDLLLSLLRQPPNCQMRLVLAAEVSTYTTEGNASVASRSWWHGVRGFLLALSAVGARLLVVSPHTGQNEAVDWYDAALLCASQAGPWDALRWQLHDAFVSQYREAHEMLELALQSKQLDVCAKSTAEVRELSTGLSSAPFVIEPRTAACTWRLRLRGGVLGAFGYKLRASMVPHCLLCGQAGHWAIPHIVRDCPAMEAARVDVWTKALHFGVAAHVMTDQPVQSQRQNWYLLTVGAVVPEAFCKVGTSAPTHFNRPEGATATRRHGKVKGVYLKLLRITGELLCGILDGCEAAIKEHAALLENAAEVHGEDTPNEGASESKDSDVDIEMEGDAGSDAFLDSPYEDESWESVDDEDDEEDAEDSECNEEDDV